MFSNSVCMTLKVPGKRKFVIDESKDFDSPSEGKDQNSDSTQEMPRLITLVGFLVT